MWPPGRRNPNPHLQRKPSRFWVWVSGRGGHRGDRRRRHWRVAGQSTGRAAGNVRLAATTDPRSWCQRRNRRRRRARARRLRPCRLAWWRVRRRLRRPKLQPSMSCSRATRCAALPWSSTATPSSGSGSIEANRARDRSEPGCAGRWDEAPDPAGSVTAEPCPPAADTSRRRPGLSRRPSQRCAARLESASRLRWPLAVANGAGGRCRRGGRCRAGGRSGGSSAGAAATGGASRAACC